ncbi:unnamed protein product [Rhizophagus irregularis]|nr:unnamed protein product [Rhizophagus irregularis]
MDEIKLSDDVFEQIKDFDHYYFLTEEQKSLIDKLIIDEKLKECYKEMVYVEIVSSLIQVVVIVSHVNHNISNKNFKNWTSGNHDVDEFIQKAQLKASDSYKVMSGLNMINLKIDYNIQGERKGETKVALKCLHNSQDITAEFLKEVESNILAHDDDDWIVPCFGITKDPKTNNFLMVMELKNGSLRQHLNNNFISLNWESKLFNLQCIACGLKDIHNKGLIHHDFHCGNILSDFKEDAYVTDLGLCQPANVKSSQNSNKKYMGLRPTSNYKIPQLIFDIINQCWDADPLKRPNAEELLKEADEKNKESSLTIQSPLSSTSTLSYMTHPHAVYTSRLLDF